MEVLQANGATQLVDLAVKAGLGETLTGDGPFTVFAPTNEAFGELPAELVQSLVADTEMLKKVRKNLNFSSAHIAKEKIGFTSLLMHA